jgi:ferredoxin-type protein NapH
MKKIRRFLDNGDLRRFRTIVQLAAFVLLIYGAYFSIHLGNEIPVLSCGYDRQNGGMCYLLPLQHQLGRPLWLLFSMASIGILIGFATFLLWFIVFNKAWCGFICPLGTMQDWLTSLRKRFGIRYSTYSQGQFNALKSIKYVLLVLLLLLPVGIGSGVIGGEWRAAFCEICPGRMITPLFVGDVSQWTIDFSSKTSMILTALGMIITGMFIAGSFVKKRFFCFFCPMGALQYTFSKFAILRLKKDGSKCTKCGDCYTVCDMQIKDIADDVEDKNILRDDCILCMKCIAACPEEGCLEAKMAGFTIFQSTKEGFAKRMNVNEPGGDHERP